MIRISQIVAKKMMEEDNSLLLLDVRQQSEYEESHLPGSVLMSLEMLAEEITKQKIEKSRVILVYCRSGRRSVEAAIILDRLGFDNIYEIGGIIEWPFEVEKSQ